MAEDRTPTVYSIAAHRGFADALVAGLGPRYSEDGVGLARLTLLLPSRRAVRTVTEAFVRIAGPGLLLPRMAVIGDLDLDEALGALLDPLGAGEEIPPAADPTRRWLRLAAILREVRGPDLPGAALLRQAHDLGRTIDRLLIEGIDPGDLLDPEIIALVGDQAAHWAGSTRVFLTSHAHWQADLAARGEIDAPARRNLLFARAARRWREHPPARAIVAAGITSASPALAALLRAVSQLPKGAVILPDLDLALDEEVWDALGVAGAPLTLGDPPIGARDALTHPQYHLKLLLNRMGIARAEVRPWHRAGIGAAPPARSRAISNLYLPPAASARWVDLAEPERRLTGVTLLESANPAEQAQAVAIMLREALETPEKRAALVTNDRGLASRVGANLRRWGIVADDTAGLPLSQTTAGRLLLLLADVTAGEAAPVALLALLNHPLVRRGEARADWLEMVRLLDRELRGPRPAPGLAAVSDRLQRRPDLALWWTDVAALLAPLFGCGDDAPLDRWLNALAEVGETLCGDALWGEADGRALSAFVEELRAAASAEGSPAISANELPVILRDAMDRIAVRPPWGGHPRIAIYGVIEARMSRADLVICAGLHEGSWPAAATPEPLLSPALLRRLGVPGGDFRIGLAAHDLAGALGAPEVVLSWARRDDAGPVIPSRFVLRVQAMLGARLAETHRETRAVALAQAIDRAVAVPHHPRPLPMPSAEQRLVDVSATGLDRLRSDPYQFYASRILGLGSLDALDAEPTAAMKGIAAHAILDKWHRAGGGPEALHRIAEDELAAMGAHPLTLSLWRPRLLSALDWMAAQIAEQREEGRMILATEAKGAITVMGVRVHGRADRIDRTGPGTVGVIDYKTGTPPSARQVQDGFALQLGLLGLIAREGGFTDFQGEPDAFEYWSLARTKNGRFGYVQTPVLAGAKRTGIPLAAMLSETERFLHDALGRWIVGTEPFTARLNPDLGGYNDYDQLMRLDEWIFTLGQEPAAEGAAA